MALTESDVTTFLKSFVSSSESADAGFFDLFATDDSLFFSVSVPTRIDGAEKFRRGYEGHFGG
jgi:ketosteroid isomerase-like protein